jgi:hypothetical protein
MVAPDQIVHCKTTKETYQNLRDLLEKNKRISYIRFGDGDFRILMGKSQANHKYSEELAKELEQSFTIEHPHYLRAIVVNSPVERGMTKGIFERFRDNEVMEHFITSKMNITLPALFENGFFPNYYSVFKPEEMNLFLDRFIRPRKKMYIGSVPEDEVQKLYGKIHIYVQTPRRNAYSEMNAWWPNVLKDIDSVELVLPAAGMASRVISKRIWELNKEVQVLDLGSIVDAVSSMTPSRKWIKLKGHVLNRILIPEYRDRRLTFRIKYALKETGFFIRYLYYKVDPFFYLRIFPNAKRNKPDSHGET